MDLTVTDRRAEPRTPGGALPLIGATLRPGCAVCIVDVSRAGAQIETERPLGPGARVHVRFVHADQAAALGAVVLRCAVWALRAEGVLYRSALRFDGQGLPFWDAAWSRTAAV